MSEANGTPHNTSLPAVQDEEALFAQELASVLDEIGALEESGAPDVRLSAAQGWVTRLKERGSGLVKKLNWFREIERSIQDVIWTADMTMTFTYHSPKVVEQIGYTQDEMEGRPAAETLTKESFASATDLFQEALHLERSGEAWEGSRRFVLANRHKDGRLVWLEIQAGFLRDDEGSPVGIVGISRDVTGRRLEQEQLELLFETAVIGMAKVNSAGQFIRVNTVLASWLGYTPDELSGRSFLEVTHADDRDRSEAFFQQVVGELGRAQPYVIEKRYCTKVGEPLPVRITVAPVNLVPMRLAGGEEQPATICMVQRRDRGGE